jgi:hypothetical protein
MTAYLLSTRCLYDIAVHDHNKAQLWFEAAARRSSQLSEIRISAFSIPQIRFYFEAHPPRTPDDRKVQANFTKLITLFTNRQAVLGCPPEAAYFWANTIGRSVIYENPPPPRDIGPEVLILATAAVRHNSTRYTLVEQWQPIHDTLKIQIFDPYQ